MRSASHDQRRRFKQQVAPTITRVVECGSSKDRRDRLGDLTCRGIAHLERLAIPATDFVDVVFFPSNTGLHPEDGCGDALRPFGDGLAEQEFRHLGRGLDLPRVEFFPVVSPERLRIDGEHPRNVNLWDAIACHGLDLAAMEEVGFVRPSTHPMISSGPIVGRQWRSLRSW